MARGRTVIQALAKPGSGRAVEFGDADSYRPPSTRWVESQPRAEREKGMLKKPAGALLVLWFASSIGVAQDGRFDVSGSASSIFTKQSSGNGITQGATIGFGAFASFRLKFTPQHAFVFSYGRNKNSQTYQTIDDFHILTNLIEYSFSYMFTPFPQGRRKFTPFLLGGVASLGFSPRTTWLFFPPLPHEIPDNIEVNIHALKQTELGFVYGGGFDYPVPRFSRFSFRFQYRGFLYHAPDFKVDAASGNTFSLFTGTRGHMAEPSGGLVFRF